MPTPLWEPSEAQVERAVMTRYMRERGFEDYHALWRWSVEDLEGFWASIWSHFGVEGSFERVLGRRTMPGAEWFPGAQVSYPAHLLARGADRDPAILHASELRELGTWTRGEVREQVARIAAGLRALGVGR